MKLFDFQSIKPLIILEGEPDLGLVYLAYDKLARLSDDLANVRTIFIFTHAEVL